MSIAVDANVQLRAARDAAEIAIKRGMLRQHSPVLRRSSRHLGTVLTVTPSGVRVGWPNGLPTVESVEDLALYLEDPTGRAHLAWWLLDLPAADWRRALRRISRRSAELTALVDRACRGDEMDAAEITTLCAVAHAADAPIITLTITR